MTDKSNWKPRWQADDVEIESTNSEFKGHFELLTHRLRFKKFSGDWSPWITREQVKVFNSVAVLLYDPKLDSVVLVEQVRTGVLGQPGSPWLLETVAGYADMAHESLEQAVAREAKEEANVDISTLIPIYEYYPSPGGACEKISIFCGIVDAQHVGGVHGLDHENEDIQVHTLQFQALERLFNEGMLTSSSTLISFLWLQKHRAQLQSLGYV